MAHSLEVLEKLIRQTSSAGWGLFGVLVGALLSRLSWYKDNRRQEYRELIEELSTRVSQIAAARPCRDKKDANLEKLNGAVNSGFDLVRTRVFIGKRSLEKIEEGWRQIQRCAQWDEDDLQVSPNKPLIPYDQNKLEDLWRDLQRKLVKMCRTDMKVWRIL